MTDTTEPAAMPIEDYLARGGQLTSPANVPPRYRGELLRLMASFVDSELAASAGFADTVNAAPGITARIAASRITLEKADHAGRVLDLMGDFGADEGRYAAHHPWADRLPRDAELGRARHGDDLRLAVFHYPISGWVDAVVMNVLQGLAAAVTLEEMGKVSYAPLAEVLREIAPREKRHTELGLTGLAEIAATEEGRAAAKASIAYWRPRVADSFGAQNSARYETLRRFGLRHRPNEALLADWTTSVQRALAPLGLD
ncbi:Phenylacetic acid catabolic protein [Amaricoccus solimangrovi]|uniref:Phenylacetic acid catabolic n=1 Tax=Amaricoccus solimangrovi TaxID=2589815 RepID=A0A501WSU0_9RHOB|nr:Phenylacetic acid catabolic protein [Amaricoccus solimangrovi]TPE51912.1 phenylacetic acid catabolic [Amaricoccus solimangrovi]